MGENKTEKGSKADDLKSEKATKATSKATLANKTEKGEKADNIKASHSVSHSSAFRSYMGGNSFVVDKDDAKSKDDVKDMKATKASSKATEENKTEKGAKADNIKASHSVSFADVDAIKNERHTKA